MPGDILTSNRILITAPLASQLLTILTMLKGLEMLSDPWVRRENADMASLQVASISAFRPVDLDSREMRADPLDEGVGAILKQ
jgi:hypothetical protein